MFEKFSLLSEVSDGSSWSFPEQASNFAADTDFLYHAIFWISLMFFLPIIVLMVYFCIKYRRREGVDALPSPSHNTAMELAWTIIPCFFLVWMFAKGAVGFMDLRNPPDDAFEIKVIGKQWSWNFQYPNGQITDTLYLALDQPVKFKLHSEDVLHSFFVPEFRQKWDLVPGRYGMTWVIPTRTSTKDDPFHLYCAEYCGTSHSEMVADVIVLNESWDDIVEKYATYKPGDHLPHENGEYYYNLYGCVGCHSIDGSMKTGPSLKGGWKTQQETDKGTITVNEDYITESILEPTAKIRAGFKPQMPQLFNGRQLNTDEIDDIIAFIRKVNDDLPIGTPESSEKAPESNEKAPESDEKNPETEDKTPETEEKTPDTKEESSETTTKTEEDQPEKKGE